MTLKKKLTDMMKENPKQIFRVQMSSGGAERSEILEVGDDYLDITDRVGNRMSVSFGAIVHIYPVDSK